MSAGDLTHGALAENVNTKFRLPVAEGEPLEIELIEVSEARRVGNSEQFAIVFRGTPDFFLQQNTYRLEHERLGACDLFLVPIAREEDGFRYEAVFARTIKKA